MKKTVSHFVWVGHIGASLSFSGCILLLTLHNPLQLIHFTILSPLLYLLLWFCGKREQVWYDESEMTGSLAAFTSFCSTVCALGMVLMLFQDYVLSQYYEWISKTVEYTADIQKLYTSSLILILLGSVLVSIRFYLNSWLHCSTSYEIETRCNLESTSKVWRGFSLFKLLFFAVLSTTTWTTTTGGLRHCKCHKILRCLCVFV